MNDSTQKDQIKQIVIGDYHDYALIVLRYYETLYRYVCLMVPFKVEAEKIVIQTMHNLWMEREKLHSQNAVRGFLEKNARAQCMSWLRSRTVRRRRSDDDRIL